MTSAVFMGTPEAAIPILDALEDVADVALVVTRPDKPRGRSSRPVPPPVEVAAAERGLQVAQPTTATALFEVVERAAPDVAVVAAYGRIIRPDLLRLPPHGFVNVHFSLLPRWRGASPVARAILAGDAATGVSLMVMDEGLDTGPVLATSRVEIASDDTTGSLTARLAGVGADLLRDALPRYLAGQLAATPQDDSDATAAAKIEVEEAFVDPARHSVEAVDRAVRAFDPKPGAWTLLEGERLKLLAAEPSDADAPEPGVAEMRGGEVLLGTRTGAVRLVTVQPAGKPAMDATSWMNGRRGEPARLGK